MDKLVIVENLGLTILLIAPLVLLNLLLVVISLLDFFKRKYFRGNKWLWLVLIVLLQYIGPISYLLFGRKDNENE